MYLVPTRLHKMALIGSKNFNKRWIIVAGFLSLLMALLYVYAYSQELTLITFATENTDNSPGSFGGSYNTDYTSRQKDISGESTEAILFENSEESNVNGRPLQLREEDSSVQYDLTNEPSNNGKRTPSRDDSKNIKNAAAESMPKTSAESKEPLEKHQIVFEKVHKAASCTFQTILLRFAMSRNKNVLLMQSQQHLNEQGTTIDPKKIVKLPKGDHFDILCNHIVFDEGNISPYFPNSTTYMAIVREPFSQFRSAFIYYSQVYHSPDNMAAIKDDPYDPIRYFLRHPVRFSLRNPRTTYVNNRQSVDLGFPVEHFAASKQNPKKIEEFVRYIHKRFDIVLIAELFDESVVLVRRYMNWCMKDILYLKNNVIGDRISDEYNKGNWVERNNFTQEDLDIFKKWAPIDIALYNSSLKVFKEKIKREERFDEEVKVFKKIRTSVAEFCTKATQGEKSTSVYIVEENEWTKRFEVSLKDCIVMGKEIGELVKFTRNVQSERLKPFL